jgi:hypothetical protein
VTERSCDELISGPEGGGAKRRSRWIWRITGLLVVGVLAVTVGPGLLSSPHAARPHPAGSPRPSPSGNPAARLTAPAASPLSDWTPRGAGLGAPFVAVALARMRAEGRHVDQLLWAGSLDGHDHVVVVSYRKAPVQRAADDIEIGALRVRHASQIATTHSVTIGFVGETEGLVGMAWHGGDNHTRLLVLSYPEPRQMQVSAAVGYHPTGALSRRWRDRRLTDGVEVTDLGRTVDPEVVVRPADLSSPTDPVIVPVQGLPAPPGATEVTVAGASSPSYAGPPAGLLVGSLAQAMHTFCDLRDADSRVLWSGRLAVGRTESGKPARGRAALVVVRRHDGATFQAFVYARGGDLSGIGEANPVRWSVADQLPYAFNVQRHVVLISPGGPGAATVTPAAGPRIHVQFNGQGVATVPNPDMDGAGVVLRAPSGRVVLRATLVNSITADIFGFGL